MFLLRAALLVAVVSAGLAYGQTPSITTLAHFGGTTPAAVQGSAPRGGLTLGPDGQWYGTAVQGGAGLGAGKGVAYKIAADGTFTLLAEFDDATTGSAPTGALVLATDGNFYGTTFNGGTDGLGTVFQMTPSGTLTSLYSFRSLTRKDTGDLPATPLIQAPNGFLYGTTSDGGANGYGTIFKILPGSPNTPIRLADFSGSGGSTRGYNPSALMLAKDGNFYGTTANGGLYSNGTVFRLTPAGVFTTITDFGAATGLYAGPIAPRAALIQASNGLLYGTSASGGTSGDGTVFSVTTAGVFKVLINFTGDGGSYQGGTPETPLFQATDGFLYGTTRLGGTASSKRGTIFRLTTAGAFKSLIQFTGGSPVYGSEPQSSLVQDNNGHLFGTTSTGGTNSLGTVFSLNDALPIKATVSTGGVDNPFGGTRATLTGTVNPQGTAASYYFEYGLTTAYGSRIPATDVSAGAGKANVAARATATGLRPSTVYHYRVRASNGGGITWGPDQSFTTGPNPNVVSNPMDQLVGIGAPSQLSVSVIGVSLAYNWYKTGVSSVVGTKATLPFARTALANAGSYLVVVADGLDVVKTPAARLGVISTANSTLTVNEGAEITLTLQNAGPDMTFQWKTAAGDVVNDGRVTGAKTAALRITNAGGADTNTYFCTATLGGLTLDSGSFALTTRLRPVMNMPAIATWTTNGQAFGSVSAANNPTSYIAVNLPDGVKINATTGVLYGRPLVPGTWSVKFKAQNLAGIGPQLEYPVTVAPALVGEAGNFAGLAVRDATANSNLGGKLSFSLTAAGTGTGSLVHKGASYSFTTALNNAPGSTRTLTFTAAAGVKNFPAVTATLIGASGDVAGTVNGAAFTAFRNPWTTQSPVPAAQSGRFNVAFSPVQALVGDAAYPQGSGCGALVIDTAGNATWSGKLADGTATTGSAWLTSAGTVPMHHPLYATGTGSAQGTLEVGLNSAVSTPDFDWYKAAQTAATRSYMSGFPLHDLDALGCKYVKPASGTQVLGLSGSTANAKLTLAQGGLAASLEQTLNFPATNVLTVATPNPNTVTISSLDLNTGLFSGSFVIPDAVPANKRTTTFSGVLLPAANEALGCFNLAQLPSPTTSAQLSGSVKIAAP